MPKSAQLFGYGSGDGNIHRKNWFGVKRGTLPEAEPEDEYKRNLIVLTVGTYEDLKEERSTVREAIRLMGFPSDAMEDWLSSSHPQIVECIKQVQKADVLVLILGSRYGSIDKKTGKSFTELEYHEAMKIGLPCLVFFRSDDVMISPRMMEKNPTSIKKLEAFKKILRERHSVCYFESCLDLTRRVMLALLSIVKELRGKELEDSSISSSTSGKRQRLAGNQAVK